MGEDDQKDSHLNQTMKHLDKEMQKINRKFDKLADDFKVVTELKVEVQNLERNLDRHTNFVGVGAAVIGVIVAIIGWIVSDDMSGQRDDIAALDKAVAMFDTKLDHHQESHDNLRKPVNGSEIQGAIPDEAERRDTMRFEDMKREAERLSQQINEKLKILEDEGFLERATQRRPVGG